jgi:hypothetical protein
MECSYKRCEDFGQCVVQAKKSQEIPKRLGLKRVWKAKIPAKIKVFMWLMEQDSILTKDNMLRRNWQGDPCCYFCDAPKTMVHLMFECPIAKVVWGL